MSETTKAVDWTKPIQTRDGRKAEFVRRLAGNSNFPIRCVVFNPNGDERMPSLTENGRFYDDGEPSGTDIINVPPEPAVVEVRDVHLWKFSKEECRLCLRNERLYPGQSDSFGNIYLGKLASNKFRQRPDGSWEMVGE